MTRTPTCTHWGSYDVETRDGRIVALYPDASDPFPSPIGPGMPAALYAPARIRRPMIRQGWLEHGPRRGANRRGAEPFVEVEWNEALDLAARELERIRRDFGNRAIFAGSYGWASAGRFHHAQSQLHRFLNLIGGYTYSVNSYSIAALEVILPHVLGLDPNGMGEALPTWEEMARHTELVVAFGGISPKNTQVNPGGVAAHVTRTLQERAKSAGVHFITVGPVRSDTGDFLDAEWLCLRPNTDTALMLGLCHTLVAEQRHDAEFLERCCVGFDRYSQYLLGKFDGQPKTARWAAEICGIHEQVILDLARKIAEKRTVISVSWSVQRADHGEQPYWAAVALACLSGSMGRPGGGFAAGLGAIHSVGVMRQAHFVAGLPSGKNPVTSFIPVARIADLLLGPGETIDYNGQKVVFPDIHLIYWAGGNPFHHHQDLNRLVRAWQIPDTVIVHEPWWNPLARFADIVFPVATTLERDDIAAGRRDGSLIAMHKAAAPPGEAREDFEVFSGLAEHLGVGARFTEGRTVMEWLRAFYRETVDHLGPAGETMPDFDSFWAAGKVTLPLAAEQPPLMERLRAGTARLNTPSGKIEIFSETIDSFDYDDCPGHPAWLEPAEWLGSPLASRFPLHLVSNQPRTRLHSQYDLGECSRASKIKDREPCWINPEDAATRGIASGDIVRIFNDRGACLAGAIVTDQIAPRVIQLATGAWYDPACPGEPGGLEHHGNPNMLTLDKGTSRLAQGPISNTTLVDVERFSGEPPAVGAFVPPPIAGRAGQ